MKQLLFVCALLLCTTFFAQVEPIEKRFGIAAGPSATSGGYGVNLNFNYVLATKWSAKLRMLGAKSSSLTQDELSYVLFVRPSYTGDVSVGANYFFVGNATASSKAGLYVGVGTGYLYNNRKYNNVWRHYAADSSYNQRTLTQGWAANINLGGFCKVGKGKIYCEVYWSQILLGGSNDKFNFFKGNPPTPATSNYSDRVNFIYDAFAILCFNVGYSFLF
jgi:hypothetical protein